MDVGNVKEIKFSYRDMAGFGGDMHITSARIPK